MSDPLTALESGLTRLLERIGSEHPRYTEALALQSRLLENISAARIYGDTETRRAERAQIVDALNRLALETVGISFNELSAVSEHESRINEIERRLYNPEINVVNLFGVAGSGKTFLARALADRQEISAKFPGGVVWVDCKVNDSLSRILGTIARGIDVGFVAEQRSDVLQRLAQIPTLLIFDSFDVVSHDDEVLSFVVRLPRPSKAMIISRERVLVSLPTGVSFRLGALSVSETAALLRSLIPRVNAIDLNRKTVEEIHSITGGLPLAIALIARTVAYEHSLDVLQALKRSRSRDEALDLLLYRILNSLSPKERRILEALSVFASHASPEAVCAIAQVRESKNFLNILNQSGLVATIDAKYILHPAVQGLVRRQIAPDLFKSLEGRMVDFFLEYVRCHQQDYKGLEQEWFNIRYAVELAYEGKNWQIMMEFVHLLGEFLDARGDINEYILWLNRAIEASEAFGEKRACAVFLHNLAIQHQRQGRIGQAIHEYQQSLQTFRGAGDRAGEAASLGNLGLAYRDLGRIQEAIVYYQQALALSREIGDRRSEASHLGKLGLAYRDLGDIQVAIECYHQALALSREIGDCHSEANLLANLGSAYADLPTDDRAQNLEVAIHHCRQALEILTSEMVPMDWAMIQNNLGNIYLAMFQATGSEQYADVARKAFELALEIFTPQISPLEYAAVQNNLANALLSRYEHTGEPQSLEMAIQAFQQALRFRTPEAAPVDYAATQSNLGIAWQRLFSATGDEHNLDQAIDAFEQALQIYKPDVSPRDWLRVTTNLSAVYAEADNWSEAKRLAAEILQIFRGAMADQEALEALAPWYERMGNLAIQNQDFQFTTRILAEAAHRFELQGAQTPAFIPNRLAELKAQIGDDLFAIIWAEVQGILTPVLAQTLQDAGGLMKREQFSEAVVRFTNALDLLSDDHKAPEVQRQRAVILSMRGICLRRLEQWEEALKDQEQALHLFERVRDFGGEARSSLEMGHLFELMNNYEDARLHYMDAYRLYRRADDRHGMATTSEHMGRLEFRVRMLPQAVEDLEEARDLWVQLGERGRVAAIELELEDARAMLAHQAAKAERRGEDR